MDTRISVQVFEWQGDLHCNVDRIGRADLRKYAPRTRLASFTTHEDGEVGEQAAMTWAIMRLVDHLAISVDHSRAAGPASPSGDRRGDTPGRRASVQTALPADILQNAPTPPRDSDERSESPS